MKIFFRFIFSRLFLLNLLLAIGITLVLIFGVTRFLRIYTHHGDTYTVPDFKGKSIDEVKHECQERGFRFHLLDSGYYENLPPGAVADQFPKAGLQVKENRRIYLIKNAENAEKVIIPNVIGVSLRQARSELETYNLEVGRLEYVPDIATNVVIRLTHNGEKIQPGTEVETASVIDIVLGQGLSDEKTYVPNLLGLGIDKAGECLNNRFLNLGASLYDATVNNEEDSLNAKIYKQYPAFDTIQEVNLGTYVDVWLTADSTKIPEYIPDSVLIDTIESLVEDAEISE